jgi:hypothetical protein
VLGCRRVCDSFLPYFPLFLFNATSLTCVGLANVQILPTKNAEARDGKLRRDNPGLSPHETTQEDDDSSLEAEDARQENLFRAGMSFSQAGEKLFDVSLVAAYKYASFQSSTHADGTRAPPADSKSTRGFVIELHGVRYGGLRLTLAHAWNDLKETR